MSNSLLMLIKLDADTMAFASLLVSIVSAVAAIFAAFYANIAAFYAKKAATKRDPTRVEQNTQHAEHFSNKILSIETPMPAEEKQEDSQAQAQVHQEPLPGRVEQKTSPTRQEATIAQAPLEAAPVERKALQVQPELAPVHPQREIAQVQTRQEASEVRAQRDASQAERPGISISVKGEAMGEVPLELFLTLQDSSLRVSRVETLSGTGKALGSSPCKATDDALVFKSTLAPKKVQQWWDAGELTSEGEGRSLLRVYLLEESGKEVYRDMPVSIVEGLRNVGITSLIVWTVTGSI